MKLFFAFIITVLMIETQALVAQTFPESRRVEAADTIGSIVVPDPFRWLEDKNSPEVKEWTHAQHAVTEKFLEGLPKVAGLEEELRTYFERDVVSSPFFRGDFCFQYKRKSTDQQSKLYVVEGETSRLLFDPHTLDKSGKAAMGGVSFTFDGSKAAIGVQIAGDEIYTYYLLDTKTGKEIAPPISGLRGFSWTRDGKGAYISRQTRDDIDNQRSPKVYLYTLGNEKPEEYLTQPTSLERFASVSDTKYGNLTVYYDGDFNSNNLRIKKTGSADEPLPIFESDKYRASMMVFDDKMYITTNYEAPNGKVMVASLDKPQFEHWQELYPEQQDAVLSDFEVTKDWMLVLEKRDILRRILVLDKSGTFERELPLPEMGIVTGLSYHEESNTVFAAINTFTAPAKVYALDGTSLEWRLFYEETSIFDLSDVEGKITFYESKDGTKVPLFLVHKKGLTLDGTNPTLLYGYGGFNVAMEPSYIGTNAAFIKRGGVYAVAGLRGGSEYGEKWHQDGMLRKKQNTFDDFIAAAEFLIKEKYTSPRNLVIYGGSNGGLLVGAVTVQRPDLFNAVICGVPLLDMARFHKFLIARYWIPEYGNPEDEDDLRYILTYSPYHNISEKTNYPTMIVKAGENDTRVDPLHAKKFVAAMQARAAQTNPIYLEMEFESGHGSGKPISRLVSDADQRIRFLLHFGGYKGQ